MKRIILILALIPMLSCSLQAQKTDYELVEQTINYYLEGGTNNDWDMLKKAFHKNATMKSIGEEGYREINALEFFKKAMKPGPKSNRKTFVSQITVSGNAANARLEIVTPDLIIVDFMNLLKVDGEWKIVSKIFDARVFKTLFPDE